jgi:hypothetical protein
MASPYLVQTELGVIPREAWFVVCRSITYVSDGCIHESCRDTW